MAEEVFRLYIGIFEADPGTTFQWAAHKAFHRVAMRQIAGVFAQLEKARLVGKLKAARDRKRAAGTKVEGRKSYAEIDVRDFGGEMITLARKLRRKTPKGGRRSLRAVGAELAVAGFVSASGEALRSHGRCPDAGRAKVGKVVGSDHRNRPSLQIEDKNVVVVRQLLAGGGVVNQFRDTIWLEA